MKRVLLSLIVLACCAAAAQAELKVGYIDTEVLKAVSYTHLTLPPIYSE